MSTEVLFVEWLSLRVCYTMSGSFLSSLEKRLEEYVNITYAMQIKIATPAAIYGILLSVEIAVWGFMIAPKMTAKSMIPNVRKNVALYVL